MREKMESFVVTFPTTTAALAWEDAAKQEGLSGRLIPIPQQISVGCGLAWKMALAEKETAKSFLQTLAYDNVYELLL